MVKGVRGARRRLGGGSTRRSDTLSNKKQRVRDAVLAGKNTKTVVTRLTHEDQAAVDAANITDARDLLSLLTTSKKDGKMELRGNIKPKPKRSNTVLISSHSPLHIATTGRMPTAFAKRGLLPTTGTLLEEAPAATEQEEDNAAPYSKWEAMGLAPELLAVMRQKGFEQPFEVQERTLPLALSFKKDVLASAQTGSGKTLAFGLPVVQRVMEKYRENPVAWEHRVLDCLIITPTRELAMQVHQHLLPFVEAASLSIAVIVGGMSDEKQLRLLNRSKNKRPHLLVATPGRLFGLLEEGDSPYLERSLTQALEYLIVDEADKMIQTKHFEELSTVLEMIRDKKPENIASSGAPKTSAKIDETVNRSVPAEPTDEGFQTNAYESFDSVADFLRVWKHEAKVGPYASKHVEGVNFDQMAQDMDISSGEGSEEDYGEPEDVQEGEKMDDEDIEDEEVEEEAEDDMMADEEEEEEEVEEPEASSADAGYEIPLPDRLKVFITSATLTLEARHHEGGNSIARKQGNDKDTPAPENDSEIDIVKEIFETFHLNPRNCVIENCSSTSLMVDTLQQSAVYCLDDEKELTVYYFLLNHTGRTIIFVNAISSLRRLMSILTNLGLQVYALHSEMQQRQRLKNLDRLKENENCVVVATDVAARGLDVKGIQHVLHYQFPRSLDSYVHRCGRTARCKTSGFSLALISPEEKAAYKRTCDQMKLSQGLPTYRLDLQVLGALKERLSLAKQLDKAHLKDSKVKVHNNWLEKNAKDMDMHLDDNLRDKTLDDQRKAKVHKTEMYNLRAELAHLIASPLGRSKGQFLHTGNIKASQNASAAHAQKLKNLVYGKNN